ncbi:DUF1398 domain-containing protein [Brevundimonas sp. VNH65]|uniref:DUF1398 domain-containing protein n=1 Tax=Brevundimonas sp. VNH65 TaxID=3400917 RepID=UPI003C040A88
MTDEVVDVARRCLDAAETGAMSFPEIVGALVAAGVESYRVDFRRARAAYYRADGSAFELAAPFEPPPVAEAFDAGALRAAIAEAQAGAPGYTYPGFRQKAAAAGCADYLVSAPGRRALYVARTGETHVERFPD